MTSRNIENSPREEQAVQADDERPIARFTQPKQETNKKPRRKMLVTEAFLSTIGELDRLTADEEHSLAKAWREYADADARDRLISANVRLVVAIAKGLNHRGIPLEELIAEGNVGLIRAVDRFNPESGCRLSTFAFRHIRHAMTALFASNSLRGKLRHDTRKRIAVYEAAQNRLMMQLGRMPTDAEAAEETGWSAADVANIRRTHTATSRWAYSLAVQATYEDREGGVTQHVNQDEHARRKLNVLLSFLSPTERQAMEMLHGIDMFSRMTPQSVANVMGLSTSAVMKLKAVALSKMIRQRGLIAATIPTAQDAA